MQIKLQGKNIEITPAINDYVIKKVTNLGKFIKKNETKGGEAVVDFTISQVTNHHKNGDIFRAHCSINLHGDNFYSSVDREDIYQAITIVKENILNEMQKSKDHKQTLFKRGAASVKKMLKRLSDRNPFTAKY
ncbi:MAG: ribosome-associated translation inhibitor RaiA [Patescibacteria group bacterium]